MRRLLAGATAMTLTSAILAGCGAKDASPTPAATSAERAIINLGGIGQDPTSPFAVRSRAIRVEYKLVRMPATRQVGFVLEKEGGNGIFDNVTRVSEPIPESLKGSKDFAVLPGRYRLRIETEVSWSAKVYEASQ